VGPIIFVATPECWCKYRRKQQTQGQNALPVLELTSEFHCFDFGHCDDKQLMTFVHTEKVCRTETKKIISLPVEQTILGLPWAVRMTAAHAAARARGVLLTWASCCTIYHLSSGVRVWQ